MATLKHPSNRKPVVIFVPGSMLPGELAYGPLLGVIGDQIQPVVKELEVYATKSPPPSYGLEMEVEGIRQAAESAGTKRFHLVGYSGGGAAALAFAAKFPGLLDSLALIEPPWIGTLPPGEASEEWERIPKIMDLPPDERIKAFLQWHMRDGLEPPKNQFPPGPPPAWMEKRPAGIEALTRAFNRYNLDRSRFRDFQRPVYYALGSLSNRFFERTAGILAESFPDMLIETFDGRSHLDPPHRAEPERFARALYNLWAKDGE